MQTYMYICVCASIAYINTLYYFMITLFTCYVLYLVCSIDILYIYSSPMWISVYAHMDIISALF